MIVFKNHAKDASYDIFLIIILNQKNEWRGFELLIFQTDDNEMMQSEWQIQLILCFPNSIFSHAFARIAYFYQ